MAKLQPYLVLKKLNECRDQVLQGIHSENNRMVCEGIEGLASLIGRCLIEFNSTEDLTFFDQGLVALLDAKEVMRQGNDHLKHRPYSKRVDHTRPSNWISFDGKIKTPLYVDRSQIPNAGKGLFCEQAIRQGQVIAPCRMKIQDSGDFLLDWRKFSRCSNGKPSSFTQCKYCQR